MKFVFCESKEAKRGGREFTRVNDRPTMRRLTKLSRKRNEKKGEYQSGQMGQTVNLLVYTFGGSNPSSPTVQAKSIAEIARKKRKDFRILLKFEVYFGMSSRRTNDEERSLPA